MSLGLLQLLVALALPAWIIFGIVKLVNYLRKTSENRPHIELSNFILTSKVVLGVTLFGILLYFTPFIPEKIKLVLSLVLCLSSFISLFILKSNNGSLPWSRVCIFSGQVLFGITLLLFYINGVIGYSYLWIFALWTILSIYIWHEFGNPENKICTVFTSLGFLTYLIKFLSVGIKNFWILIILVACLSAIEIFAKKLTAPFANAIKNTFATILFLFSFSLWENSMYYAPFVVLLFYLGIALLMNFSKANFKALLILCIPIPVLLLGIIDIEEFLIFICINFMLSAILWIIGKTYLKVLSFILIFAASCYMLSESGNTLILITLLASALTVLLLLCPTPKHISEPAKEEALENE